MTNHGKEYIADLSELNKRIDYYESVIADSKKDLELLFSMERLVPVEKEPTESQIRKRMELTQESYYSAREKLREEAYGTTHSKPPGQSWGDYCKSY